MCPILDGYGVMGIFKFPYTPSCEPRLRNQLAGDVLGGTWRVFKECGKGGVGGYSPCHCIMHDSAATTMC
jgi:hypothetical protein